MSYDDDNVFAKILRGEIPNRTVLENEHVLAFHDISQKAPTHVLVIPKGKYISFDDFAANAGDAEIVAFVRAAGQVASDEGVAPSGGGEGFRIISNSGKNGVQEVPHFHLHVLGGRWLGQMLKKAEDSASTLDGGR